MFNFISLYHVHVSEIKLLSHLSLLVTLLENPTSLPVRNHLYSWVENREKESGTKDRSL
jgi:hypothetical protein